MVRLAARDEPARDTLDGAISDTTTPVVLESGVEVSEGARLDVEFEVMRVIDKPTVTNAEVRRGWDATANVPHVNATEVLINPRFFNHQYRAAVNHALAAIGAAMGRRVWDETQTFSSSGWLIPIPEGARKVFAVGAKPSGATALEMIPYRVHRQAPSFISTGAAIELTSWNPATGTAYIGYETAWTTLTNLADDLDAEYPNEAVDLIILGATAYLADSESFARIAATAPHLRERSSVASAAEVRLQQNSALTRFLTRRTEAAAALGYGSDYTWMRG